MREIWTIGHWTCPESTFISLLAEHGINLLTDVRAHPGSRTSPQFGHDLMPEWLDHAGIEYVNLVNPSIATTSTPLRQGSGRSVSQVLNTCLQRPSTMSSSLWLSARLEQHSSPARGKPPTR